MTAGIPMDVLQPMLAPVGLARIDSDFAQPQLSSVDRNTHGLIDQVVRLEAELVNAKQRAERADLWLSRIREQIEGDLIPSFTAMLETKTARLHRKF